jgi:uncharacterized UBP type Zn finger protein
MSAPCEHLAKAEAPDRKEAHPSTRGCKECLEQGSPWVELRLCLACGHVGCCDSSPNRHATAHFHATGHPVIKNFEPGQPWAWCYVDGVEDVGIPAYPGEAPRAHLSPPRA